jgi:uncharacterized protein (TIGR03067 family)
MKRCILAFGAMAVVLLVAADARQEDVKQLSGRWSMIMGERDGQALSRFFVRGATREVTGNVTTITIASRVMFRAKFSVDPTTHPKTIDYDVIYDGLSGADKGSLQHGIYELNGDRARFCMAAANKPRPTEFKSTPGSGWTLSEWKRNKP